jgi:AcrR family transcriptional regulator
VTTTQRDDSGEAPTPAGESLGDANVAAGIRAMRADAVRNRTRILEAAEEVLASEGISVPIDVVAERAGVGVGTLYRHFPTKEALFEAIVTDRLLNMVELANSYCTADDPGAALFAFLQEFAQQATAKHDLFDALGSAGIDIKSRFEAQLNAMMAGVDRLRQRAEAVGAIRSDVEVEELIGLVVGACQSTAHSGFDEARLKHMVTIVCDGIRAPSSS